MKEIDINNLPRKKTYEWFRNFKNPTYSLTVTMDVTKLVNHTKNTHESFFIDMLYIVTKSLNSVSELRMRFVEDKPVIYDEINPAITVLTTNETFENVRFPYHKDFKSFYQEAATHINKAKNQTSLTKDDYNPTNAWNEFYITCLPWIDFTSVTHPIPEDLSSQTVPRVCWGKYHEKDQKYEISLNITVSHIFVDGLHVSKAFQKIQESLDDIANILN